MNKGQKPMFKNNRNINNNSNCNSFEKWSMPRTAKTFSQDGKSSQVKSFIAIQYNQMSKVMFKCNFLYFLR